MKALMILILFAISVFAKVNPLLQKGEGFTDIASPVKSRYVEVPLERISYTPTMRFVDNMVIYSPREITRAECVMDYKNTESCPIDREECGVDTEYVQGSAKRGTGYISCAQLDPRSYYDPDLDRCVLASEDAEVCSGVRGSRYDSNLDQCVLGSIFDAQLSTNSFYDSWSFTGNTPNLMNAKSLIQKAVRTAGGSSVSMELVAADIFGCGRRYKVTHDAKANMFIKTKNSSWLKVPPGKTFYLYLAKRRSGSMSKCAYGITLNSNPGKEEQVLFGGTYTIKTSYEAYTCTEGSLVEINGVMKCDTRTYSNPSCSAHRFFQERDGALCRGVRKEYEYYDYFCPDDENIFGENWVAIDPGGDCGEYNLAIDSDGDGLADRCNNPTPPLQNCERHSYKCGVNPGALCVLDEKTDALTDFTKWDVINYYGRSSSDCPEYTGVSWWNVDPVRKNSVFQKCSGLPTYFVSDYTLDDGHIQIEGSVRTDEPQDNDWFGFVFGFKNMHKHYVIDWSRGNNDNYANNHDASGNPTGGAIPLTLAKASHLSSTSPLLSHESTAGYTVLQRYDNGGWVSGQTYRVKLDITKHDIKMWTGKAGQPMHLDINYHSDVPMDISGKVGFYNFSLSRVSYKDFKISWEGSDGVKVTKKRPLVEPAQWIGTFKEDEYGVYRDGVCNNNLPNCPYGLSNIDALGNKICFKNKAGTSGCFEAEGSCIFSGHIDDLTVENKRLFSFLNTADDIVDNYQGTVAIDRDSPTGIAVDFMGDRNVTIPLEQVVSMADDGDKVTVDFWINWEDGNGMPVSLGLYSLWLTDFSGLPSLGFNTGENDLYGIADISSLRGGWHRVTAIFAHHDIYQNELYIDGVKQSLSEVHTQYTDHNISRADITGIMNLSSQDANRTLWAKLAGINVYKGSLTQSQIDRLVTNGSRAGISRLAVDTYSIKGYDEHNVFLGEINSTCPLSGKVGFFPKEEVIVTDPGSTTLYNKYIVSFPYQEISSWACEEYDYTLRFDVSSITDIKSVKLTRIRFADHVAVSVNGKLVYIGPYGGTELSRGRIFRNNDIYNGKNYYDCDLGTNWSKTLDIDIRRYLLSGRNTISIKLFSAMSGNIGLDLSFIAKQGSVSCVGECSLSDKGVAEEVVTPPTTIVKQAPSPIVAAKVIDNRIEFWNSFENKGESGFIEVLKYVNPRDSEEGYKHEFEEMAKLSADGFTAFKTFSNNVTYAVSKEPMGIEQCSAKLKDTHYSLAEKDSHDPVSEKAIAALSRYVDGEFGDYCIIQKSGPYDNYAAQYALKTTYRKKEDTAWYCSPWECEGHMCGYAACPIGTDGTMIMEQDKAVLTPQTCIGQKCDLTKAYFRYCGNPHGCDTNDITVMQTEDGRCKKAECQNSDLFNPQTGTCEKIDCKYIKMDGKCYKKVY